MLKGASAEDHYGALDVETVDVLGMVFLVARKNGLDLAAAILRKWRIDPTAF